MLLTRSFTIVLLTLVLVATATPGEASPLRTNRPRCGNGILERKEQCDDGNKTNSDGCRANCKLERQCGIYWQGQKYPAPDGCNTCTCRSSGESCTNKKVCRPSSSSSRSSSSLCMSSNQCPDGKRCSTERGDCRSACRNPGDICPTVCMGVCETRPTPRCGNGLCEEGEAMSCPRCDTPNMCPMAACRVGSCQQDCAMW